MDDPPYISRPARKVRQTRHLSTWARYIYSQSCTCTATVNICEMREGMRGGGRKKKKEGSINSGGLGGKGSVDGDINGKECL